MPNYPYVPHYTGGIRDTNPNVALPPNPGMTLPWAPGNQGQDYGNNIYGPFENGFNPSPLYGGNSGNSGGGYNPALGGFDYGNDSGGEPRRTLTDLFGPFGAGEGYQNQDLTQPDSRGTNWVTRAFSRTPYGRVGNAIGTAIRRVGDRHSVGGRLAAGGQSGQSAPAWFQPGYQLPSGIQGAIARGDYQRAYGQSPSSRANSMQMWAASRAGNPNVTRVNDTERVFNSASGITPGDQTGRGAALQALYPGGVNTDIDPNTRRPASSYPQYRGRGANTPFAWLNPPPAGTISPPPTMPPIQQPGNQFAVSPPFLEPPGQGRLYGGSIGLPPGVEIGGNNLPWETGSDLLGPPIWQGGGPDPVWQPPTQWGPIR